MFQLEAKEAENAAKKAEEEAAKRAAADAAKEAAKRAEEDAFAASSIMQPVNEKRLLPFESLNTQEEAACLLPDLGFNVPPVVSPIMDQVRKKTFMNELMNLV